MPFGIIRFAPFFVAILMTASQFQVSCVQAQSTMAVLGVRFGPGQAPCANPVADCSSPQDKAMLKVDAGGGPEWGFVDPNGKIIHSGFRGVVSFDGSVGWGFVHRERFNRDARCPDVDETDIEHMKWVEKPCEKWEPVVYGWTLVDSEGHIRHAPHVLGNNSEIEIQGKLPVTIFDVGKFSEGLAAVNFGSFGEDRWGYVDETGQTIIQGRYAEANPFSDGLAAVQLPWKNTQNGIEVGRWTFVDRMGVQIGATFYEVGRFSQGLVPVSNGNGWGYADRNGKIVIPLTYAEAGPFSENLAATRTQGRVEDRYSTLNYVKIVPDSHGNSVATLPDAGGEWGYIDRTGKEIIPHKYSWVRPFSEGLASVCKFENGKRSCGAIDVSGNTRIPFVYSVLSQFSDGLALGRLPSGKRIFIDHEGRQIGNQYDAARVFRGGIAPVKQGGLWGLIDRTGRMILQPQFLELAPDWPDEIEDFEFFRDLTGWLALREGHGAD